MKRQIPKTNKTVPKSLVGSPNLAKQVGVLHSEFGNREAGDLIFGKVPLTPNVQLNHAPSICTSYYRSQSN